MVKQPTSEQSEFTMSSEDFPALPGTSTGGVATPAPIQAPPSPEFVNHNNVEKPKQGIQTTPEGKYWFCDLRCTAILNVPSRYLLVTF